MRVGGCTWRLTRTYVRSRLFLGVVVVNIDYTSDLRPQSDLDPVSMLSWAGNQRRADLNNLEKAQYHTFYQLKYKE